jgi:hypothetical protein
VGALKVLQVALRCYISEAVSLQKMLVTLAPLSLLEIYTLLDVPTFMCFDLL